MTRIKTLSALALLLFFSTAALAGYSGERGGHGGNGGHYNKQMGKHYNSRPGNRHYSKKYRHGGHRPSHKQYGYRQHGYVPHGYGYQGYTPHDRYYGQARIQYGYPSLGLSLVYQPRSHGSGHHGYSH